LVLRAQARPERPADKRREDAYFVYRQAENFGDVRLVVLHPLRFVVDGHRTIVLPDDGRRKRFHRVVVFNRQDVFSFKTHGGVGQGLLGVAARLW
jgi:hypothetical protein